MSKLKLPALYFNNWLKTCFDWVEAFDSFFSLSSPYIIFFLRQSFELFYVLDFAYGLCQILCLLRARRKTDIIGDSTINTLALQRAPCWVFRKRNMKDMVLLYKKIIHHAMIFSPLCTDHVKLLSHVWLFASPWTVTYQAPLSMGFYRQEYWSGLPFPSPGDLSNPGIEPWSPALQANVLPSEPSGKFCIKLHKINFSIFSAW